MMKRFNKKQITVFIYCFIAVAICGLVIWEYSNLSRDTRYVVIKIPDGKIRGNVLTTLNNVEYYSFYQVYYAAAPEGQLRYKPPQKRKPWNDTSDATSQKTICYQLRYKTNYEGQQLTEDCLYVNIFTPKSSKSDELMPVLVYIFGGAFKRGRADDFDGSFWMDHGIVAVVISSRLGAFGFLSTEDDVIPGNLGLKDQRFALEWIHDNIQYFNGDNKQVTLVGGSSGATCVGLHVIGPWSSDKVLFHRAIQQSNSPIWNYYNYDARKNAFELGRALDSNFDSDNSTELLKVLQSSSANDTIRLTHEVLGDNIAPIIESTGDFSYPMLESFMNGNFKKVSLLAGFNSEEKIATEYDETILNYLDSDPARMVNSSLLNIEDRNFVGGLIKRIYTNKTFSEDFPAYIRYFGDDTFVVPVLKQSELTSKYTKVYVYEFDYKGPLGQTMDVPSLEGCNRLAHGEEILYFWGNKAILSYPAEDRLTSKRMVQLWSNFVKTGNPTPTVDPLLEGMIWPAVNPNDTNNIPYLHVNETLKVFMNPRKYQSVKQIYDKYLRPPYIIYTNNDYFLK